MKKIIIILSIFVVLSLAGVMYSTQVQPDEGEIETSEQVDKNYYTDSMPEIRMNPLTGFCLR